MFPPDEKEDGWTIPLGWAGSNPGNCRSCGAAVMWCISRSGIRSPVNRDGTSHFASCPDAASWRRRKP